ncbi:fasciclin-like arabinogalactan protein 15 [Salvia miltiorrhiza]|uniref:fasciclin-like arabinogalactan protein 15 n=1 Tax=Salvia miltiorrhiza TaxID=226208 RepID=UPI0025AB85C5|nr:fasciclin-like arabinogalactan protein 15 [Salvia miltiorrhiza]
MAPSPSLAPAPAPGPDGPHHHFNGESQVKDFIQTLLHYGDYNELADILVNLTSLATETGRLVSEGYVLTVLAPNDEAMAKLTTDQLSEPGAPEQIMYYHLIPEYQTEESMYNSVRRFGKVNYDTLKLPHKVVAEEADGSVKFGQGEGFAYLFDPDIYTDGRISVQGVDGVLFPDGGNHRSAQIKKNKNKTDDLYQLTTCLEVERRLVELRQTQEEVTPSDVDRIFREVVTPNPWGRIMGLGMMMSKAITESGESSSTHSTSTSQFPFLVASRDELIMREELSSTQRELEARRANEEAQSKAIQEMQAQIALLMRGYRAQSPSDASNGPTRTCAHIYSRLL